VYVHKRKEEKKKKEKRKEHLNANVCTDHPSVDIPCSSKFVLDKLKCSHPFQTGPELDLFFPLSALN
jgi:hypothetical protein